MLKKRVIEVAGLSDVGCQRHDNEDYFSYWASDDDAELERKGEIFIVADGMGGHEGGQEASHIAVEAIQETYAAIREGDPQAALTAGFHEAHRQIVEYALQHPQLRGMGTTATAAVVVAQHLYYAHVGDSRLYLVRDNKLSRLTHDHSYVSRLVENGTITPEEAEVHPQRHVLTAALGVGQEVAPDAPQAPVELRSGDTLVVCTDGLWGLVSESEIQNEVSAGKPAEACRALIAMAKDRGGPDNITLQVARIL